MSAASPQISEAELQMQLKATRRLIAIKKSRSDLLEFTKLTMPDPADEGDATRTMYSVQKHHKVIAAALEEVEQGFITRLIITMPPRHGKLCSDDTPVITTDGWKTHGDLEPGDFVFHPSGEPTEVVAVSEPGFANKTVTFTNGESIDCHENHEWTLYSRQKHRDVTVETGQLGELGNGTRFHFQAPLVDALQFDEQDLPVAPYTFGAWLGDGSSGKPVITHAPQEQEVICGVVEDGYAVSNLWQHETTGVVTTSFAGGLNAPSPLAVGLKETGAYTSKHIPDQYLRSSYRQRMELLAGLIDTDGHVCRKTGRVRFINANRALVDGVIELATSLAFRPYVSEVEPRLSSSGIQGKQKVYYVGFQPHVPLPCRLKRKQFFRKPARRKYAISSVKDIAPKRGKCIQVASPDGLYLVGRKLVPTHNSELASKRFPAWYMGRNPLDSLILATYSDDFAKDFGRKVRGIMQMPAYSQIFPDVKFAGGAAAADRIELDRGGLGAFVGAGGAITGRGADLLLLDDPTKNSEDADSATFRDKQWDWFNTTAMSRLHGDGARCVIIQTRWHEDDLIGRLTDPTNDYYQESEAEKWKILNLPAIAGENDPMGREPGEALWPDKYSISFLNEAKTRSPRKFSALYQCSPAPAEGIFYLRKWVKTYKPSELPKGLKMYAASDHAVATKQNNDFTVMIPFGVDDEDNIWILPDVIRDRIDAGKAVDLMLEMIKNHKPIAWFAERGHISKSIGPFLNKRMQEEGTYCYIDEVVPSGDKETRAQSMRGRVSMGKVYFPDFVPWFSDALDEMLKFPAGKKDDFVDCLSMIGLGLSKQVPATKVKPKKKGHVSGTMGWLKEQTRISRRMERMAKHRGF